jgi:hypothetical protein
LRPCGALESISSVKEIAMIKLGKVSEETKGSKTMGSELGSPTTVF